MESRNGTNYTQNYDVIAKWVGDALLGQTLSVIGVDSGRIETAFGLEPIDIKVQAGRLDLILRDEYNICYHIEEQRNFRRSHLYRFAAYHFLAAKKLGAELIDIILASGDVYQGEKRLITKSGAYTPLVIDFSERNGQQRLAQIRSEIEHGAFDGWLELVFLPLYGKQKGEQRAELVEQIIRFETELYHQNRISKRLVAATLIMANKLIDKNRLKQLWEVIKMLDIIEIAREKGIEEGRLLGIQEGLDRGKNLGIQEGRNLGIREGKNLGIQETTRLLLIDALIEKFGMLSPHVSKQIHGIVDNDVLKALFRQVFRCQELKQFEAALNMACPKNKTHEGNA